MPSVLVQGSWRSTSWFYSAIRMLTARVHSYPLVRPERGPGLDYISMMVNDLYVTLRFLPQHIVDSYISPLLAPSTSSARLELDQDAIRRRSSLSAKNPLSFALHIVELTIESPHFGLRYADFFLNLPLQVNLSTALISLPLLPRNSSHFTNC
jgi:hypothetical protein